MAPLSPLLFLDKLDQQTSERAIEEFWEGKTFPIIKLDDFENNWVALPHSEGIFVDGSGSRCCIVPQKHFAPQCTVHLGSGQESNLLYETILFAKLQYHRFKHRTTESHKSPLGVQYRIFVDQFINKLPFKWREIIVIRSLHSYDLHTATTSIPLISGIYQPLSKSGNIRLIAIQSAAQSYDPIYCTIREVDFTDCPAYEALSYVWGSPSPQRSITLNDRKVALGENLEAALRHLRRRDSTPRVMWIDALCINQSNPRERGSQVAQMDQIYANASGVVIWLGQETNTSARVFTELDINRSAISSLEMPQWAIELQSLYPFQPEPYCAECSVESEKISELPALLEALYTDCDHQRKPISEEDSEFFNRIRILQKQNLIEETIMGVPHYVFATNATDDVEGWVNLLSRPWWRRVWVLQEASLAKKLTVQCGNRSEEWSLFQALLYRYIKRGRRSHAHFEDKKSRYTSLLAELFSLTRDTWIYSLPRQIESSHTPPAYSLAQLLSLSAQFEATDGRDKIFALLSLLPTQSAERMAIKPNYNIPLERLNLEVTKFFLKTSRSLDVLAARPLAFYWKLKKKKRETISGPSWVQDWSANIPDMLRVSNSIGLGQHSQYSAIRSFMHLRGSTKSSDETFYHASLEAMSPWPFTFSSYDEILELYGLAVDTITRVALPMDFTLTVLQQYDPNSPGHLRDGIKGFDDVQIAILKHWQTMADTNGQSVYHHTGQTRLEAFWRTVFLDRILDGASLYRLPKGLKKMQESRFLKLMKPYNFPPQNTDDFNAVFNLLMRQMIEGTSYYGVNPQSIGLSLFVTEKGYLGIGHPNTRPGDIVIVLLGGSTPWVLREYPEGCIVVGESYVHGIMDGEIMELERAQGRGRQKSDFQTFKVI